MMSPKKKLKKRANSTRKNLSLSNHKQLNNYARYSGMVIQMGVIIFAGVFGGLKLDAKLEREDSLFTIILSLLGVFASLYIVLKDLIKK
ncbi:MAG: AtpZ/AtpI family protein [Bacteroidota bacterium]|nr:AtpZ/AtpI family protein [Bacteroidota bacterium]